MVSGGFYEITNAPQSHKEHKRFSSKILKHKLSVLCDFVVQKIAPILLSKLKFH
jgi:hypothetical protein